MNSTDDIADWLRAKPGKVRLRGTGSRAATLPPSGEATTLDLRPLNQIVRLDPGDQTCTVQSGVLREQLDDALAEHDLELPCLGQGTIGGLFASDPLGPAAAGAGSPRSLLLGVESVLADGTRCKSGARVVKSVAGFDVHKLLVGSQGRLFVAAELHLRLKPRARVELWFCNDGLEQTQAMALLHALRHEQLPPTVLQLRRATNGSFAVSGKISGRSVHVDAMTKRHSVKGCEAPQSFHVDGYDQADRHGAEVLHGAALPSKLPDVLSSLPQSAAFQWLGGGRFEATMPDSLATDRAIDKLAQLPVQAAVLMGAAERHAVHTATDSGVRNLTAGLKQALDPDGILA